VSIVLIPNKFLDTPHYHVERLRHDDPRLDDVKASFERAAELAPSTDTPYTRGKAEEERARPKQEAVVKGIVPETPAPMAAQPAAVAVPTAVAAASTKPRGLWGRIVAFFTGEPAPAVAPAAALPAPAAARPARAGEPRGDRHRSHDRDRREAKRDDKRGERRDDRKDGRRGEKRPERRGTETDARPAREQRAARPAGTQDRPEGEREGRRPQARRGERKEHIAPPEEATLTPVVAANAANDVSAAPTTALLVSPDAVTADATSEERRGRRRRRRRGRGGRDGEGEAAAAMETSDAAVVEAPELPLEAVPRVEPAAPAPAEAAPGNGSAIAPQPAAVASPHMIVVPPTYSLPPAQPAPMPVEQLQSVLELAGLTLVQTEASKLEDAQARMAGEAPAVRIPRERPVLPPLETGPLVQVETRGGTPSSAS
jgi:ribonuclease E